jgi:hypothetical protein
MKCDEYVNFVDESFKKLDSLWEERSSQPADLANSDEVLDRFFEKYLEITGAMAGEKIE